MRIRRVFSIIFACVLLMGAGLASSDAPSVRKLSLQAPSRELVAGKDGLSSMQLVVKSTPADADISSLTWSSKKPQSASVDDTGLVTAHAGGTVSITVTDTLTGKKASKAIKIWELPSGVDIRLSEKNLRTGRSAALSSRLSPSSHIRKADKALSWFSSDASVASVNAKGRVTAVAPGEATITVMTVNGRTDSCVVTVTE